MNPSFLNIEPTELFDTIFRRLYPQLFFYARRLTGHDEDAEDVVVEAFEEMWKRRDDMEWGDKIDAFLYRTVFTRAINLLKHRQKSLTRVILLEEIQQAYQDMIVERLGVSDKTIEHTELRQIISTAINRLPEKCREVFRMSYLDDLSNKEIAQQLGISVRTVEAHIYMALKTLRKQLKGKMLFYIFLLCAI